MGLSSPSGLASFQQTAGQFLDLSDILAELIRSDNTAWIGRVSMNGKATETIHSWTEDALNPITVTAASTLASNSSSLTLYSAGGTVPAHVVVGALLRDNAISGNALNEILQVTGTSGGSLTVSRAYGGSTGTAHAAAAVYTVFAVPSQENADMPADISLARSKVSNFTQILIRGIQVGYTAQKIRQAGVPDEFGHQVSYRMKELMRELDASTLLSVANSTAGSGSTSQYRSMAGLMQFAVGGSIGAIQVLTTGATFTTNETISPDIANTMGSAIWYNGGMTAGAYNGFLVMGGKQKRRFAGFDQSYRRLDYNDNRVGFTVEKFLSDLGYEFEIIVDPWMPDDVIVAGDLGRIALVPLDADEMRVEDIAKTGRSLKAMVTGQYTIEVKNAPQTTAIHTNLA